MSFHIRLSFKLLLISMYHVLVQSAGHRCKKLVRAGRFLLSKD